MMRHIDNKRDSNIELLRIILMMGIIALHINYENIGGAFKYVSPLSIKGGVLYSAEAMWLCAVNVFVIITGFFMYERTKVGIKKPLLLLCQLTVYRMLIYVMDLAFNHVEFNAIDLISHMLPVNYFIILYIVLYVFSPYINTLLHQLSDKDLWVLLCLLLVVFSVHTTFASVASGVLGVNLPGLSSIGIEGNQGGYTIVHFISMYILGTSARRFERYITGKKPGVIAGIVYICSTVLLAVLLIIATTYSKAGSLYNYDNPLIVTSAISLFVCFRNINIKSNRLINVISKGCLGVYLLQNTLIHRINTEEIVGRNTIVMCLSLLLHIVCIFAICWLVDFIYNLVVRLLTDKLNDKYIVDLRFK